MPLLKLSLSERLDQSKLDRISDSLTSVTKRTLRKKASLTRLDIDIVSTYLTGKPTDGFTFSLTITITQGSNSEEECQLWLREAFAVMREFGSSADTNINYLTIVTIPSTQWGFNGLSQEARKLGE